MGVKERYDVKKSSNPNFKTSGVKQRYEQRQNYENLVKDANSLITSYNGRITADYSKYGDYSSHITQYDHFVTNANSLLKQLDSFKNLISEDEYKKISDTLNSIASASDTQKKNVQGIIDFYSSFEDENQYKTWETDNRLYAEHGDLTAENVDYYIRSMEKRKAKGELNGYEQEFYDWIKQYDLTRGYKDEEYYNQRIEQLENKKKELVERRGIVWDKRTAGQDEINQQIRDVEGRIGDLKYLRNRLDLENAYEDKGYSLHKGDVEFDKKAKAYEKSAACDPINYGKVNTFASKKVKDEIVFAYQNKHIFEHKFVGNVYKINGKDVDFSYYDEELLLAWRKYSYLTEDEYSTYCYLKEKDKEHGTNEAEKFISDMDTTLDMREENSLSEFRKEQIEAGGFKGAFMTGLYNVVSVPANVIGGLQALPSAAVSLAKGEDINIYSDSFALSNFAQNVRATTSDMIDSPGWKLVYNAVMSTADSLFAAGVFGTAAPYILATSAATSRMKELVLQGASDFEIVTGSLASGLIEVVTEKISIDRLFGGDIKPTTFKQFLKEGLIQAGVEGSEEVASEVLNNISDEMLRGSMSDYNQAIRRYEAEGLSKSEATKKAANDVLVQIFEAALSGMISGGIGGIVAGGSQMHKFKVIGDNIIKGDNVDTVLMAAEYLGTLNPEIKGQVQALNDYTKSGKNGKTNAAYKRTLGKVAATVAENVTEVKQSVTEKAVSNELNRRGVDRKVIDKVSKIAGKFLSGQKLSSSEQGYLQHNSVAATVMQEIKVAQEQVKAGTLPQSPSATAPSTDGANVQNSAAQWAVELVNKLTTINSAMSVIKLSVNGKSTENTGNSEVNRMMKILSIASGKTTAEQEAEAGDIPYSQYIREKEAAEKQNTAENGGEASPMENVDGENNAESTDAPNIFEEVFSEENRNEKMSRVQSLGEKFGTPVTFSEEVSRGKYNPQTREITLNPNLTIGQMYMFVFKHEWVHDLKNRKLWAGYKKFLFGDSLNFTDFCETNLLNDYGIEAKGQEAIAQLRDKYYKNWRDSEELTAEEKAAFDKEAAEEEMVCDFVAERQLGGIRKDGDFAQESFDALSELANRKRNIFQRLVDWIKSVIEKIKGDPTFTDMAEELQYLNERIARVYESKVTDIDETVTKHYIKTDIDGNIFVDIPIDNINVTDGKSIAKNIAIFISDNFKNLIDVYGQKIQINKITNDEFRNSNYSRYILGKTAQEYFDKLSTINNADEILKAAKNWIGRENKHQRKDDIVEFAEAYVRYRVSNRGYIAKVLVATRLNGAAVLYDITDIKNIKITESPFTMADKNPQRRKNDSANSSLPQKADGVKSNSSVPESHSIAVPFSDEFKADKRKRYASGVVKKYGGAIDTARVEGYLKDIAEATENRDYRKAYKIAAKAAKYIADNGAYTIEKMVYKKKARELLKSFVTDDMIIGSKSELNDKFMQAVEFLKEYYFNQFNENAKTDADILIEEVARELAEAPSRDSDMYRQVQEIRDYVRAVRLRAPDEKYNGDFGEGYETFRRKNQGRIWLSKSGDVSIDAFYDELNGEFGEEFFPGDITNVPDQLKRISEVVNLEANIDGIAAENVTEATEYIKEKLTESVNEIFEKSQNDSLVKAEDDLAEQIFDAAVYNRTEELSYKASEAQRKLAEKRHINGQFDELLKQDREARAIRQDRQKNIEAIRKTVNRLYKRLITNSNTKNIPEDFKEAVTELCEIFFRSDISTFDRRDFHTLSTMYKNLQGSSERSMAGEDTFDPEVSNMIDTIADTLHGRKLQELDYLQVMLLRDIIDNINHIISEEAGIMLAGKKYEIDTLGRAAMQEFKAKKRVSDWKPIEGARNFFKYNNMTPVYFFDRAGGTLKKLYKEIRNGMDKIALNLDATKGYITKTKEQFNYDSWKNEKIELTTDNGETLTLTIEQALHLYATAKRELTNTLQNSKHLFGGGIVLKAYRGIAERIKNINKAEGDSRGSLEKILVDDINNTAIQITLQDITNLSTKLTDEQVGYMDAMVKYMSENMAALGNETSLQLYGIRKFNENYYIPYNSAEEYIASQPGYKAPKTHQSASFTKNTVQGANTPLVVESFSEVVARHCNQMIQYNALAVPLSNFNKVYNYTSNIGDEDAKSRSLKNSISSTMGEGARKYIDRFLEDMNGDIRTMPGEEIGSKLLRLHKASAVMASASVVVQQPASIGRAMAYIGPQYFVDLRPHQGDYEQMKKYAPVAILKEMGRFDTGVGSSTTQWLLSTDPKGVKNKAAALLKNEDGYRDDIFSAAAGKADEIAWGMMWAAAKNKVAHDTNLTRNSEEFLQEAGRLISEVIDRTQVYDSTISRSQMMRSKSLWAQMVTSFMAEPTVTLNMLYDMAHDINSKHFKLAGKKLGAAIFTAVLTAALKSFVTAARDDEEDKSYWEKYFRDLTSENFDNLNIANMIPIVRDIYSLVQGYDVERADMTAFDSLVEAFTVAFDEDKEPLEKLEKVASSIGTFTGIPIKNIWRDMEAAYNVVVNNILNPKNKTTGQGIKYAMQEGLPFGTEDSKSENYARLLEAAESGDKKAYEKIYDHLVELGADESDIKAGLKKQIKEESKEYEDDFQKYMNRLYKMAFFKGLEDDEKKKVKNNLSNFVAEDIVTDITGQKPTEAHEKVKEAQEEGVAPEYYYLSKIATNVDNADTDGSGTVTKKEKLAAIRKMNVSNDIKAALIALYS